MVLTVMICESTAGPSHREYVPIVNMHMASPAAIYHHLNMH